MNTDNFLNKVIIIIIFLVALFAVYYSYDYFVRVKPQEDRIKKLEQMGGALVKLDGTAQGQIEKINQAIINEEEKSKKLKAELTTKEQELSTKAAEQVADEEKLKANEEELTDIKKTKEELEEKKKKGGLSLEDEAFIQKQIEELNDKMDAIILECNDIRTRIKNRGEDIITLTNEINLIKNKMKLVEETVKELKAKREKIEEIADGIRQQLMLVAGATEKERKEHDKYLNQGLIERCLNIFGGWGEASKRLPRDLIEANINTGLVDNVVAQRLPSSFTIQDGKLKHENKTLGMVASPESIQVLKDKLDRVLKDSDKLIEKIEQENEEASKKQLSGVSAIIKEFDLEKQINDITNREIPQANNTLEGNQNKIKIHKDRKNMLLNKKQTLENQQKIQGIDIIYII
ncbi:MAG: hypothetical protein ACLTFB_00870 [Candidatus Phytoplasma pyri]